jgi:hypothetical protein
MEGQGRVSSRGLRMAGRWTGRRTCGDPGRHSGADHQPDHADRRDPDQSKAFRKNFAGIGYTWLPDGPEGAGFAPPKPYPSWVMNSFSYLWEAPVPMPVPNNPPHYDWDEDTLSWSN